MRWKGIGGGKEESKTTTHILPNSFTRSQFPQSSHMIRRSYPPPNNTSASKSQSQQLLIKGLTSNKISRISRKRSIPNPPLMSTQNLLQLELIIRCWPNFHRRICWTGCEVSVIHTWITSEMRKMRKEEKETARKEEEEKRETEREEALRKWKEDHW